MSTIPDKSTRNKWNINKNFTDKDLYCISIEEKGQCHKPSLGRCPSACAFNLNWFALLIETATKIHINTNLKKSCVKINTKQSKGP